MGTQVKRKTFPEGVLIWGDCMEVMKSMPDQSVDLIIGSPPYEDARLYLEGGKDLGIALQTEEWVKWRVKIFKESLRVCKGLVAYVVGHGKRGTTQWSGSPALLAADLIRSGVCLRNPAIYQRHGIPGSGGPDWFKANYEWIICATNEGRLLWSNNKACGHKPLQKPGGVLSYREKDGKRVDTQNRIAGYKEGDTLYSKGTRAVTDIANPELIIDCGVVGGGNMGSNICAENEAPYPEKIPDRFIRSFCPPDGVVMDPFEGSGPTLAVAVKNGRKFISIDLRKSQIKLMERRLQQARTQKGFGIL